MSAAARYVGRDAFARTGSHGKVCIIGTGYVGTANAIGFAELGWHVTGYDIDRKRVAELATGIPPYREAGLDEHLHRNLARRRLTFTADLAAALDGAAFAIVAVPTPQGEDGAADLSALDAVIEKLAKLLPGRSTVVVLRSTVPPGTSDAAAQRLADGTRLLYCPEFLREGSAIKDFMNPDRTIIGAESSGAAGAYAAALGRLDAPVIVTSRRNAELIKCCSNAFLALKISFANEVANLCTSLDAEASDVLLGVGCDKRIGEQYLTPGIGFGGPCIEKDLKSLDDVARKSRSGAELFAAALRVNEAQPRRVVDLLESELGTLRNTLIGVWGLAFKAGTDDVRSSLALRILADLDRRGARVVAYDPAVRDLPLPGNARLVSSALDAANADALLVLTEWPQFKAIDATLLTRLLRRRIVVDGRNVLDGETLARAGLRYRGVGRSSMPGEGSQTIPA